MSWKVLCALLIAAAFVTGPARAQRCVARDVTDADSDRPCCTGPSCGAAVQGYQCYSVSSDNVQCWEGTTLDASGARFGTTCEFEPGFNIVFDEVGPLGDATPCGAVLAGGSVNNQLLRGVGGYSVFESQILKRGEPRILRTELRGPEESSEPSSEPENGEDPSDEPDDETDDDKADDDDADDDDADDHQDQPAIFSEITTSLEAGDWDFRSVEGDSSGVRLFWRREQETGRLYGASASYQEADPDLGQSTRMVNGNFNIGHVLGDGGGSWGLNATVSKLSGFQDDTLFGAGGYLGFSRYSDRGAVFSGGALFQFLTSDRGTNDVQTVGYGLGLGVPIGDRMALDLEAYGVSILETYALPAVASPGSGFGEGGGSDPAAGAVVADDSFYTLSGQLSLYLTSRFALMLGYRVLEGIDGLDSQAFTFGGSSRWR